MGDDVADLSQAVLVRGVYAHHERAAVGGQGRLARRAEGDSSAGVAPLGGHLYFPDAQAVLAAWHERQITTHLDQITGAVDPAARAIVRLEAALHTYAHLQRPSARHHGGELATLLYRGEHVDHGRRRLRGFVQDLIAEAVRDGDLRDDVATDELADYCLHALTAAGAVAGPDAVQRLVTVTLAGLGVRPRSPLS